MLAGQGAQRASDLVNAPPSQIAPTDTGELTPQPEQLTPDQIAAQQTDVGFGPGVTPPYPEGSPGYQDIQRARPLLANEIPSATAQAPTLQESIAASLPQVAPTETSQRIPLAPYGGYAPTTAPEAYRQADGGIAGVINAIDFIKSQPIIDQDQARQIMHLAAGGARTAARLTGQADVEQGMEENLSQTLSGFTTPEALAQLALLKNPVARALFAGQQLSQVPEDIANIARAYKSGDKKELGRAIASASVNATMGVSMAAEPLGITARLQSRAADTALERGQITEAEHAQLKQYYSRAAQQPAAAGAPAPAPVAAPVEAGVSPAAQAPAAPAAAPAGGFGWENIQLPGAEAAPAPAVPSGTARVAPGAPVGQLAPREIQNIATAERNLKSGQLTPAEYDATVVANLGPERAKAWPTGAEVLNPPAAGAPEAPPGRPVEAPAPPDTAAMANMPDWMRSQVEALSAPLEANGVADQIEELAAQQLTAGQIARKLGLDTTEVLAVRSKRGIPSMNMGGGGPQLSPEFQAWAAARQARAMAPAPMPIAPTAALETAANDQPGAPTANVVDTAVKTMPEPQGDTVPADAGATQSIPLDQMATRPELMQYKRMDDAATGTTEQDRLTGEYDPHKAGIMLLWEPSNPKEYGLKGNQKYIVANGHYRYDFFSRQGVPATDVKILRQSDGYSAGDARAKAAEVNIADGKGTIFDQANFIREQAAAHGQNAALGRARQIGARGQKAATIALQSGPDLYTSFINEKITPDAAAAIAETARGNEPLQRLGLQYALQGEDPQAIANFLQSKQARAGTATPTAKQVDLFGTDDTAAQEDIANGKRAGAIQKELSDQINAVAGAARRPEKAAALGVNVDDPAAVAAKLQSLRVLRERARRWAFDPQVRDVVYRGDLSPEEAVQAIQAPATPTLRPGEAGTGDLFQGADQPFNLAGETGVDFAARQKVTEADAAAKAQAVAQAEQSQTQLFGRSVASIRPPGRADMFNELRSKQSADAMHEMERRGIPTDALQENAKRQVTQYKQTGRYDPARGQQDFERALQSDLKKWNPQAAPESAIPSHFTPQSPEAIAAMSPLDRALYEAQWDKRRGLQTGAPLDTETTARIMAGAGQKLKLKANRNQGGFVNPEVFQDAVDFGKRLYGKGMDFARWSGEMIRHLGEKIREHLGRIWEQITDRTLPQARERGSIGSTGLSGKGGEELPSQADFEAAAASDDGKKMRGHVDTVKRMTEVSPDVKTRVAMSMYDPSSSEVLNRAADAAINAKGLDKATVEAMQKPPTTNAEMAMHHRLAVRLDQLGEATADPAAKANLFDQAAMVRDNMVKGATTPAQALAYIRTIGKTSPEGLIRTAQKLMTEMIKPEDKALLDQINRLRAEIAKLKDPKARRTPLPRS